MDDLSFEEFEIEYKYLKAVIEGGLEKKPDNILIYATSNRRHLVREKSSDKLEIMMMTICIPPIQCRRSFHWFIVLVSVFTMVHRAKRIPDNCESSRREKRNYYAGGRAASGSK